MEGGARRSTPYSSVERPIRAEEHAQAVVARLVEAFQAASNGADFSSYLKRVGSQPVPADKRTPAAMGAYMKSEVKKWTRLLRAAGAPQE